jgi:thiamine-monophosphate kinase
MREFEFIDWIRTRGLPGARPGLVKVGPGDDCAVLAAGDRKHDQLLKTDGLIEGLHFDSGASPLQVGYKALCRPLSDIAACGGRPVAAVVFAAINSKRSSQWAMALQKGLARAAEKFKCPVVGGDVSVTSGPTTIAASLLGTVAAGRALLRSSAQAGDTIFVTGELGGSILGRHLAFVPRIEEGCFLQSFSGIGAAMDISDGLARDLHHILRESGRLGCRINARAIPISKAARRLPGDSLKHALGDGEDYELLFTVREKRAAILESTWPFASKLTQIGKIEAAGSRVFLVSDGQARLLRKRGWEHGRLRS